MIEIKTFTKDKKSGSGTVAGRSSTSTYVNTVVSEAEHAGRADRAKRADNADMADYANKAGSATTAAYATKAGDIDTDSAESLLTLLENYLRKDFVDKDEDGTEHWEKVENRTSFAEAVKFLKGITASGVYSEGDVTADGNMVCKETVKTKNLEVTGSAHFFELVIDKVKAMGGAVLITPADGFDVNMVVQVEGGYQLYWRCDDGNGKQRDNMWKVGDQALCMSFNQAKVDSDGAHNTNNKYYWALVTEVSDSANPITFDGNKYHYIVISSTDYDGTVNPKSGDSIVMLGYRGTDDAARQSAIYISAYSSLDSGLTAPLFAQYRGINDFDLASHRKSYFDAKGSRLVADFETSSGQTVEEYVDGQVSDVKNGLDDKASKTELKETGIDVEAGKITLTADKTVFQDGSGNEVAMFADGKLNAGMIDAKQIVTDGLQTNTIDAKDATIQNLNVENAYVSGKIIASSGKVGYFSISDNGELWFDDGHDAAHRPMELSNTVLFFTHSTDGKTNDVINWLGSATHNNYGTYLTSDYWLDDQQSSPTKSKVGLLLSVENGTTNQSDAMGNVSGNFAIYAVKGMMAGLRPAIRRIEYSATLDVCDHTLVCINQSEITLTLPSNPQRGQYYVVIQRGTKVNIRSTKSDIYAKGGCNGVSTWYSDTYMQETHLFFDGVEWNIAFFN